MRIITSKSLKCVKIKHRLIINNVVPLFALLKRKQEQKVATEEEIKQIKAAVLEGFTKKIIRETRQPRKIRAVKLTKPSKANRVNAAETQTISVAAAPEIPTGVPVLAPNIASTAPDSAECVLISYKLKGKTSLEKVKFVHALDGRNERGGFLNGVGGKKFARGAIIVPKSHLSEAQDFLKQWKVQWEEQPIVMPAAA